MKKNAIKIFFLYAGLLTIAGYAHGAQYPQGPDLQVTPGKLCDRPTKYRYPENIAYCERDVVYSTKEIVIGEYDTKFNYKIATLPREDFKIDHLIPLCAGGSNDIQNLWPQHKTIYVITDPLEPILCAKMAQGRLKQADAVGLVIEAKTHLDRTKKIIEYISRL